MKLYTKNMIDLNLQERITNIVTSDFVGTYIVATGLRRLRCASIMSTCRRGLEAAWHYELGRRL